MSKFPVFLAILSCNLLFAGKELRPVPWPTPLDIPERFTQNASGEMTISRDKHENALRFDVTFTPNSGDFWCYPFFRVRNGEQLADVEVIRFEFKAEQADESKGYQCAYAMFGGNFPYHPLPTPRREYQKVEIRLDSPLQAFAVGMNPRSSRLTYWIRNLQFLSSKKIKMTYDASSLLSPEAPASVFLRTEKLLFRLSHDAPPDIKYRLTDWRDRTLDSGKCSRLLALKPLPEGYYKIFLESPRGTIENFRSFVVVPPAAERSNNPDSFFALDSAQSWLSRTDPNNPRQPQDSFRIVSEAARRAGVAMIRERLYWGDVEVSPGRYTWREYMENAELLKERNIPVSGMFHDAPAWARTNTSHLPGDLAALYFFCRKLAETFKDKMTVWEFWNEPDIGFAPESAWDYAAAMKAAYLGFKAGAPDLPVALGGLAKPELSYYCDVLMKNKVGDYMDIFNVHSYHPLKNYEKQLTGIHAFLARYKLSDRPIWFTENGCDTEGSGRMESFLAGIRAHSPEQELLVAEFLPKMMIYMQSLGVDRNFFFVLPPYNERNNAKDWGLMRRDFSVKPGYAAFSNLSFMLAGAKFEGTADLAPGVKGFLYRQPDSTQTLVYWSISELDTEENRSDLAFSDLCERPFRLPAGKYQGRNVFGTPFETAGGTIMATRMPAYLNRTSLKPVTTFRAKKKSGAPEVNYDRSIVYRVELSDDFMLSDGKGYVDVVKKTAKFQLQIWNLSPQEKYGSVTVSGAELSGLPPAIRLPAFGKAEFTLELLAGKAEEIRICGTFNARDTSPLVIPLQTPEQLTATRETPMPQMTDPVNWRPNTSGKMRFSANPAEHALEFSVEFPANQDRWVYPEYILQLPQESLAGAKGIAFETRVSNAAAIEQMLLMAVFDTRQEGGKAIYLKVPAPTEKWEQRVLQFNQNELNPADIRQLRFGVNSSNDTISYSIRNVRILY